MRWTFLPILFAVLIGASAAAGSASASILCSINESGCDAENTYEKGEPITLSGNATLTTNLATWTCTNSSLGGKLTDVGGEGKPVKAEVSTLSVGHCTSGQAFGCQQSTAKNLPYSAEFEGSEGNGTMVLSSLRVQFVCGLSLSCTLTASGKVEFGVTGGAVAKLEAKGIPLFVLEGPNCPATASLSISYSTPVFYPGFYIVGGPPPPAVVRLCLVNADPCVGGFGGFTTRHPIGTTVEASLEGKSLFEFLYEGKPREPSCEGGALTGKTTAAGKPLIGEVSAMSFSKCGAGVCAVEVQSLPYKAEIEKTTGGNGTLALSSGGSGSPKIEVNCGGAFKCIYKASSVNLSVTGSASTPKLGVIKVMEKDAASGAECGSTMTWTATYKLTKPTLLFVTS